MAIFPVETKNVGLNALRAYSANSVTDFQISALEADSDEAVVASSTAFNYASASGGAITLPNDVVINVSAGKTITHLVIHKNTYPYMFRVVTVKLNTSEVFTYAGTITVETATITLTDDV